MKVSAVVKNGWEHILGTFNCKQTEGRMNKIQKVTLRLHQWASTRRKIGRRCSLAHKH